MPIDYRELLKGVLGDLVESGALRDEPLKRVDNLAGGTLRLDSSSPLSMLIFNAQMRAFSTLPKTAGWHETNVLIEKAIKEMLGQDA